MELQTLTEFFMWCTIINGGIFFLWIVFLVAAPNLTYRLQRAFFPIERSTYDIVIYALLGLFKFLFLFFNVIPWIALTIIA